ncbi:MAG: hypothetical protein ACRDYA_07725 [Egibacteraceae bacterium]
MRPRTPFHLIDEFGGQQKTGDPDLSQQFGDLLPLEIAEGENLGIRQQGRQLFLMLWPADDQDSESQVLVVPDSSQQPDLVAAGAQMCVVYHDDRRRERPDVVGHPFGVVPLDEHCPVDLCEQAGFARPWRANEDNVSPALRKLTQLPVTAYEVKHPQV